VEENQILKKKDIRAVIFDIDGTLVDTFDVYQDAFNQGIRQYGSGPVEKEALRKYLAEGLSLRQILQRVLPVSMDEGTYSACREDILERFKKAEIDNVKPFPGALELFDRLKKKGIKIGIATGRMSSIEDEWTRFTRMGLDKNINAIVTSKDIQYRKPAPDVVIECAKKLDVPPGYCAVIGDTVADIIAAKKAGSIAVAVTTGHEKEEGLLKEGPDILFHSLADMFAHLE